MAAPGVGMDFKARMRTLKQSSVGGNNDYLLGLIGRDHPEILERVKDEEFGSLQVVAREAGIVLAQPKKTLNLSANLERVADVLNTHYEPAQVQRIIERFPMKGT